MSINGMGPKCRFPLQVNKDYQSLSFTLDTPAKKQRKEEFERQLEQVIAPHPRVRAKTQGLGCRV